MAGVGSAPGERRGGRTAGTPNKDTSRLMELLSKKYPKWDPVIAMAEVANGNKADEGLRFAAAKEVAQYVYPKRKAIEHSGKDGTPLIPPAIYVDSE